MPLKKQAIPNLEKKLPRRHMSGRLKTDLDNNEALEFGTYYPTPPPCYDEKLDSKFNKTWKSETKVQPTPPFTSLYNQGRAADFSLLQVDHLKF